MYAYIIAVFASFNKLSVIKSALYIFAVPSVIIIVLNVLFVNEGSIVLFSIFGKRFTLEPLIYAVLMALKFLAVIYLFASIQFMIDSDGAISYFSSIMPKTTLTLMLMFKLIPTLKNRFYSIKDVYAVRGVGFKKDNGKENIKSYIPVMSVLLESSLESSFDIGEAAFVRGFLSTKRTIYDRKKYTGADKALLVLIVILITTYIFSKYRKYLNFDIYNKIEPGGIVNLGVIAIFALIAAISSFIVYRQRGARG